MNNDPRIKALIPSTKVLETKLFTTRSGIFIVIVNEPHIPQAISFLFGKFFEELI